MDIPVIDIQEQILLFYQSLHNDALDAIAQLITILGETTTAIAILLFVYLCIDKRKGFCMSVCLLGATLVINILKPIFHVGRPWTRIEGLETIRQETATGYSFPSGHTVSSSSIYTSLALAFRKRWLTIVCVVLIVLVGLSRNYLCVHWPMDVLGGWVIGIGGTLLLFPLAQRLYENQPLLNKVCIAVGIICAVVYVVLAILLDMGVISELAGMDLTKNIALISGFCFGCLIENRGVGFEVEKGCWGRKILRFVIGFAFALLLLEGLKVLFVALGCYTAFVQTTRYFLVTFCLYGLYPLLGKRFNLFCVPDKGESAVEA